MRKRKKEWEELKAASLIASAVKKQRENAGAGAGFLACPPPFHSVQSPSPWGGAAHSQGGVFLLQLHLSTNILTNMPRPVSTGIPSAVKLTMTDEHHSPYPGLSVLKRNQ